MNEKEREMELERLYMKERECYNLCMISSAAVGAFFLVGVSIIAASLFICPSLCFLVMVCILCAH